MLLAVEKILPTSASLLILGESGTGKNYLAEVVHSLGSRASGPYIRVDCAAIPEGLFEAEMFGWGKGAFTDAGQGRPGRLELAHRGTLYLDEVAVLTPTLQAKLLRFVQEKKLSRVGGVGVIEVDVRIISSSNLPIQQMIDQGRFRLDLYYRLNIVSVSLPPLRQRREDIALLAASFTRSSARRFRKRITGLQEETMEILEQYDWPGNVRELQNLIERAVIMETESRLTPASLPVDRLLQPSHLLEEGLSLGWSLEEMERRYIREVLRKSRYNFSRAAATLGINRKTLLEKRRKYGIE